MGGVSTWKKRIRSTIKKKKQYDTNWQTTPRQGSMPLQSPPLHTSFNVVEFPSSVNISEGEKFLVKRTKSDSLLKYYCCNMKLISHRRKSRLLWKDRYKRQWRCCKHQQNGTDPLLCMSHRRKARYPYTAHCYIDH
jgi:hypothetical protein